MRSVILTALALLLPLGLAAADDGPTEDVARLQRRLAALEEQRAAQRKQLTALTRQITGTQAALSRAQFTHHRAEVLRRYAAFRPEALVARLTPLLDDPRWKVRRAAEGHLAALGGLALRALEKHRLAAESLERRMRLQRVIDGVRGLSRASLVSARLGGKVLRCSNEFGGEWGAQRLIDDQVTETAWCNASGAGFKATFELAIGPAAGASVHAVGLNNWAAGFESGGIRQFSVSASPDAAGDRWLPLGTFKAEMTPAANKNRIQRFRVPPTHARRIRLQIIDHHGHPAWAILNEFRVFGRPDLPSARAFDAARAFAAQHGK